jgi:hypothetical protein
MTAVRIIKLIIKLLLFIIFLPFIIIWLYLKYWIYKSVFKYNLVKSGVPSDIAEGFVEEMGIIKT